MPLSAVQTTSSEEEEEEVDLTEVQIGIGAVLASAVLFVLSNQELFLPALQK